MKKYIALLLAVMMLLSVLAACAPANNSGNTNETKGEGEQQMTITEGKLIMSTNAAFPPYEMEKDGGGYEGIDVEIAEAIAKKLNLTLQIDNMGFDAALLAVENKKSDIVMAGVSVTEDRKLVMDFSDSYATGVQVVIVKEGSSVTMDNLGEKLIGTQRGTTGYIYASDTPDNGGYGEDHVRAFDNGATAVQALLNDQVDCVIIDEAPAKEFVKANPGLKLLDGKWVEEQYAIGIVKGNTALVEAINKALSELKADGTVDKIIAKYIKAE